MKNLLIIYNSFPIDNKVKGKNNEMFKIKVNNFEENDYEKNY